MNSRERILTVLSGQQPDTVPIFPKIAFSNTIACPGMRVIDYMTNPECMAKACVTAYRTFGWDGVALHTDIGSEGMALGSLYQRPENSTSELTHYLMDTLDDYERVGLPHPQTTEPMKTVLRATELVKGEIGKEAYVIAWTNGPLNVASQVIPLDKLLMGLLTEPETVHELLKRCTEVSIAYAQALVAAGADAIAYGHATASATVISQQHYEMFALPYETKLVAAIHACGAQAITHICGNIEPIAHLISQNGSDIIDFDHQCSFKRLRERASPEKIFRGNIDPTLLAMATSAKIHEEVRALLEDVGNDTHFILGSGCEIALNTPPENLHALVAAGRTFGSFD